mmetsp:Transcript_14204/g.26799  ORF Transcript_14204/g.26799 Transcript_14204/m.26799 type:complete len:229 (-) Transcript_14204:8-694(-)
MVTHVLFSVFDCSEAASETSDYELQDSFMDTDCYENCWEGDHFKFATATIAIFAVLVMVLIPLTGYLNNSLEGLQFETSPLFLMVRIPFLTLFVGLLKAKFSIELHAALYLGTLVMYTTACYFLKVLAIPRLNYIHNKILMILIVLSLCHTLYITVYPSFWLWLPLAWSLMILISCLGVMRYKKLPNTFRNRNSVNTEKLFTFAFRFKERYDASKIYTVVDLDYVGST